MNAAKFATITLISVIAAGFTSAQAADIRTAEPIVITAKRTTPIAMEVRVAQPMIVVAKRDASSVQVAAAKAAARRAV